MGASLASAQSVAAGGRLYDKWWAEAGVDAPEGDQPLWSTQSSNTRSGTATWRCKECHGWDYKGVDGAYGSGSHQTGFAGLLADASTMTAAELAAWPDGTNNAGHDFSAMGDEGISSLATFLREGLVDVSAAIAADKSAVGADVGHGETLYTNTCANSVCHGADGRAINFHTDDDPEYVGTVAAGNPWEFIHKVRAGQPGEPMPAAITLGWSLADIVDLLGYAQTLPTDNSSPTAVSPVTWTSVKTSGN